MAGMDAQISESYANRDVGIQQLIAAGKDSLAQRMAIQPVSLADGLASLASLYLSSDKTEERLSKIWNDDGQRINPMYAAQQEQWRRWEQAQSQNQRTMALNDRRGSTAMGFV